jgi:RecA/RadA recombinase
MAVLDLNMTDRPLNRIFGAVEVVERLSNVGILTCHDLLMTSSFQIMHSATISIDEVETLKATVSAAVAAVPQTCLALLRKIQTLRRISTGIAGLDAITQGGISIGRITEISGPPGSGKTHLCVGCTVQCLREQLDTNVIFLDGEIKFDSGRFLQIAVERLSVFVNSSDLAPSLLSRVQVQRIEDVNQLRSAIENLQMDVLSSKSCLVVIDSIAAVVRRSSMKGAELDSFLLWAGSELKKVAEQCNCAVLCTNQVSAVPSSFSGNRDYFVSHTDDLLMTDQHGGFLVPALGSIWQQCVTTRFLLQPQSQPPPSIVVQDDVARGEIILQKSPEMVTGVIVRYAIRSSGMCDDDEECGE